MSPTRSLAVLGAAAAVSAAAPAAASAAPSIHVRRPGALAARLDASRTLKDEMRRSARRQLMRRYRHTARRLGRRPDPAAAHWSLARLRRAPHDLRARVRAEHEAARQAAAAQAAASQAAAAQSAAATAPTTAAPAAPSGSAPSGELASIAACESGGNPAAVGGGGGYRGKYQFDQHTWESVGGTGDPAAAPEAEQDRRAAMLLARSGTSPWPNCG